MTQAATSNRKLDYIPLSEATLDQLPSSVRVPQYDRSKVKVGIVHLGVGGFHRAHQAVYLDNIFHEKEQGWGLCGVGLMPNDKKMYEALSAQDCLYTVVQKHGSDRQARVVGAIKKIMFAPDQTQEVIDMIASDDVKILSLTVTERGYCHNVETRQLDFENFLVKGDVASPSAPKSAIGYILAGLNKRKEEGKPGITLMSCDNIPGNGDLLHDVVTQLCEKTSPDLMGWIDSNCSFPNTMVDRITPVTTKEDMDFVATEYGIQDEWPVVTEKFMQWIMEDKFVAGRPEWESQGVQIVDNVHPYELTKIRLLNVVHSLLAYPGTLVGHQYVHEAAQDPLINAYIRKTMSEEIIPTLPEAPGIDVVDYSNSVVERFSNEAIEDGLPRICMDGSQKYGNQLMPIIRERLAQGQPIGRLTLGVATWIRYLMGEDEAGAPIIIQDPIAEELAELAKQGGRDVSAVLSCKVVFGDDLPRNEIFVKEVQAALDSLYEKGTKETLKDYS